jgi:signal transduction histidine kinase
MAWAGGWRGQRSARRGRSPRKPRQSRRDALERITAHADVLEFRRLVTVLNAMLDRLDRAFQAQRFTADASHELRAPQRARGDIDVTPSGSARRRNIGRRWSGAERRCSSSPV